MLPSIPDVPAKWIQGIVRLGGLAPAANYPAPAWQQLIVDAEGFLERWGAQAARLDWQDWELFGCHRVAPWHRIQGMGLVLLLRGRELAALTGGAGVMWTATGAHQTCRRKPCDPLDPPGALPGLGALSCRACGRNGGRRHGRRTVVGTDFAPPERRQCMPIETITIFRSGAFASEPAPDWLRRMSTVAEEMLRQVLGMFDGMTEVHDRMGVEVLQWRAPGGGMYVEFTDVFRVIAAVWIPEPADWIPFYTSHIAPFLHAHAQLATNDQLERIGNCLIAFARYGQGLHVDRECGRSQHDLDRDRERRRARSEPAPWARAPQNKRVPDCSHECETT